MSKTFSSAGISAYFQSTYDQQVNNRTQQNLIHEKQLLTQHQTDMAAATELTDAALTGISKNVASLLNSFFPESELLTSSLLSIFSTTLDAKTSYQNNIFSQAEMQNTMELTQTKVAGKMNDARLEDAKQMSRLG